MGVSPALLVLGVIVSAVAGAYTSYYQSTDQEKRALRNVIKLVKKHRKAQVNQSKLQCNTPQELISNPAHTETNSPAS